MQNKPNFRNVQMAVNAVMTMTNNNEPQTMNYSKQTQTKPISKRRKITCSEIICRYNHWRIDLGGLLEREKK